jgi:YD repeat-containing protein
LTAVYADSEGELTDLIAEYKYDGANHRVSKTLADETGTEYYYNQQWQLLEERTLTSDPEPLTSVSRNRSRRS